MSPRRKILCGYPGQGSPLLPNITHLSPLALSCVCILTMAPVSQVLWELAWGAAALHRATPEGCFFTLANFLSPGCLHSPCLHPTPLVLLPLRPPPPAFSLLPCFVASANPTSNI